LGGVLHLLAARTRHEVPLGHSHEKPVTLITPTLAPQALTTAPVEATVPKAEKRIFVGPDITPQFLFSLLSGHTEVQAERLLDIYVGKWIKLSGDVNHVGKFEYGSSTVMFSSQPSKGVPVVAMEFSEAWTGRLSVLRLGNNINVIGRIKSVNAMRVKLEDCELV
jgi:hypothetical protein